MTSKRGSYKKYEMQITRLYELHANYIQGLPMPSTPHNFTWNFISQ